MAAVTSALILCCGSATAQDAGKPFIKQGPAASCNGASTLCTVAFDTVPANHRWDVTNVACRNNLLNPQESRQTSDLRLQGNNPVATYPLLPLNITNSNAWVVSQPVLAPVTEGRRVEITTQSFGGAIVAGIVLCTISGFDVKV